MVRDHEGMDQNSNPLQQKFLYDGAMSYTRFSEGIEGICGLHHFSGVVNRHITTATLSADQCSTRRGSTKFGAHRATMLTWILPGSGSCDRLQANLCKLKAAQRQTSVSPW